MSIINEALKKAINEKDQAVSAVLRSSYEKSIGAHLSASKKSFNWGPVFIVLVLLLVSVPIVAPLFSAPIRYVGAPISGGSVEIAGAANDPSSSATRKAQFGIEESPIFSQAPPAFMPAPSLNLTGIVFDAQDPYCIINELVLKKGQSIQGAVVTGISSNRVELDFRGRVVELYINR